MTAFLSNMLCVWLLRPQQYVFPRRGVGPAVAAGLLTTAAGLAAFGHDSLWVIVWSYLLSVIAFAIKGLLCKDVTPEDALMNRALQRVFFAAPLAVWPLGVVLLLSAWTPLLIAASLHAAVQVWLQAVPPRRRPVADAGEAPPAGGLFTQAGPQIGTYAGAPVYEWLLDEHGRYHDFIGCTREAAPWLKPGQRLLPRGLVYQLRDRIRDSA